jgi:hypothetical protein
MRRLLLALAILPSTQLALGCGGGRAVDLAADAGAQTTPASPRASTRAVLAAHGSLTTTLANARPLIPGARGFSPSPEAADPVGWAPAGGGHLSITVPTRADGAVRLSVDGEPTVWIELAPEALRPARAEIDGRLVTFREAAPALDVVHVAPARDAIEELRVLHGPEAEATFRWRLVRGDGVASVRAREGRVEALDRDGRVRFASAPMWAEDAHGLRRTPTIELRDDELVATLDVSGLAYPIVVDPYWSAAGNIGNPYTPNAIVTLSDGRVAILGGRVQSGACVGVNGTMDLYDPVANTWSAGASYQTKRYREAIAPRPTKSGKILITGGIKDVTVSPPVLADTELWDPSTNAWASTGAMGTARSQPGIATLADGRVLVYGGDDNGTSTTVKFSTAETFDDATGTWKPAAPMNVARNASKSTRLKDGRVLVVDANAVTGEIYDPVADKWTVVGAMAAKRWYSFSLIALSDGRALVFGGLTGTAGGYLSTAELFDPTARTWSGTGQLTTAREYVASALLPSGHVLAAGGDGATGALSGVEIYDPAKGTWSTAPGMSDIRWSAAAALLANSKVLVAGGRENLICGKSSAELFTAYAAGQACSAGKDCESGFCADGVCCDAACTASCSACNLAGKVGTCSPVDGAPVGTRTCAGNFACAAGSCRTNCTTDAHCDGANHCASGACVARKANGLTCAGDGDCLSAHCADGVCCDAACAGQCAACNTTGNVGKCVAVKGAPQGGRAACSGSGAGTTCGIQCDGVDLTACHYPPFGTVACSANACSGGTETHASTCDGAGKCNDVPKSCGAYACGADACKSSCSAAGDCASGFSCNANVCQSAGGLGSPCTDGSQCPGGMFCTDGVCCAVAACSAGSSCATPAKKGACAKLPGTSCASGAECGSGNCVDGVCCDRACAGICEACDVPGSSGTCTVVLGTPRASHGKCGDGAGQPCKATTCDGVTATSCAGFAGKDVTCGAARCEVATYVPAPTCDGKGSCAAGTATTCSPYACGGGGCLTSCATDTDCASGFTCAAAACVPKDTSATCSGDGLSSIAKDGTKKDCTPYRCGSDGKCPLGCATSDDCAPGATCDDATKTCVRTPAATQDGGGCASSAGAPGHAGIFATAALVAALAAMRRVR